MERIIYVAVDYEGRMHYLDEIIDDSKMGDPKDYVIGKNTPLRNFNEENCIKEKVQWPLPYDNPHNIQKPTTPGLYRLTTKYEGVEYPDMLFGQTTTIKSFRFRVIHVQICFDITEEKNKDFVHRRKIFISIPEQNTTPKEFKERFKRAIAYLDKFMLGEPYELIDPTMYLTENKNQLDELGDILKLMSKADWAYFADGWENSRKCKLENRCAQEYGIQTIYENTEVTYLGETILRPEQGGLSEL